MPIPHKATGPNLSDIAFGARMFIKFGAFFIVFLIVGRVVLNLTVSIYTKLNPPRPPGPTWGFGTLPPISFPTNTTTITSYKLETKNGAFPILTNQLPVFFIPIQTIGLLSLDQAKQEAAALGFVFPPEQTTPTVYRWKRTTPLPAILDIDIVTKNFTMRVDWGSDPGFLSQKNLPPQIFTITNTRERLAEAGLLTPDIATSEAKVSYLKSLGGSYVPAVSLSEADFLEVNIWRLPIKQQYQILGPNPRKGNVQFIFSGKRDTGSSIVEGSYMYTPIEYDRWETYGLISPTTAWQQLQAGKGYIANVDLGVSDVVVRNLYLAYFDSDKPQSYLQPMYVFTGDNNFYGYVPAAASPSQSLNR